MRAPAAIWEMRQVVTSNLLGRWDVRLWHTFTRLHDFVAVRIDNITGLSVDKFVLIGQDV